MDNNVKTILAVVVVACLAVLVVENTLMLIDEKKDSSSDEMRDLVEQFDKNGGIMRYVGGGSFTVNKATSVTYHGDYIKVGDTCYFISSILSITPNQS